MYPLIRLAKAAWLGARAPKCSVLETHVSQHICWPWDIDPWRELNNGRTLTLYDLGRIGLGARTGLGSALGANRWGIVVAGASVRYRRRIKAMQRFEMRTRCIGWDHRFLYLEQAMVAQGEVSSHVLIRGAVTSRAGIVPPEQVLAAMGEAAQSPALPDWVSAWAEADARRPWPPQI